MMSGIITKKIKRTRLRINSVAETEIKIWGYINGNRIQVKELLSRHRITQHVESVE